MNSKELNINAALIVNGEIYTIPDEAVCSAEFSEGCILEE